VVVLDHFCLKQLFEHNCLYFTTSFFLREPNTDELMNPFLLKDPAPEMKRSPVLSQTMLGGQVSLTVTCGKNDIRQEWHARRMTCGKSGMRQEWYAARMYKQW